ncbi:MAG: hypothetical protein DWG82_02235 [Chloroflexi bacterium]|nr:hypothetical protein [Chloroflexota bacterium]
MLRVVVDADVSLPPALAERLRIAIAPPDATLLLARESIPRLLVDVGAPLDATPAVEACRKAAADGADVLYAGPGDGHGRPVDGEAAARDAVEAAGGRFHALAADVLMAAGWRAVLAAEASAAGADPGEAVEQARNAETALLALIEHPELTGQQAPGNLGVPNRVVSLVREDGFALDALPHRREDGLRLLRDRFAAAVTGLAGLRVVVHHGGVGPAGEAMATWIERYLAPREVHVAAITRHTATRFGPGFVGIAWTADGVAG